MDVRAAGNAPHVKLSDADAVLAEGESTGGARLHQPAPPGKDQRASPGFHNHFAVLTEELVPGAPSGSFLFRDPLGGSNYQLIISNRVRVLNSSQPGVKETSGSRSSRSSGTRGVTKVCSLSGLFWDGVPLLGLVTRSWSVS